MYIIWQFLLNDTPFLKCRSTEPARKGRPAAAAKENETVKTAGISTAVITWELRDDMKEPVLFINACVRKESRTRRLAARLLKRMNQPFEEVRLDQVEFPVVNEAFIEMRDRLIAERNFSHPVFAHARRFAEAETVVIAAPYWDLSFPASLKQYFEQINVVGISFRYTEEGIPVGLCRAKKLVYVTTAGGSYVPEDFGFGYIKALAQNFYGISDVRLISAAGLDLYGANAEAILRSSEQSIAEMDMD